MSAKVVLESFIIVSTDIILHTYSPAFKISRNHTKNSEL